MPEGWFLPVTPGTKFVTVGGAIANDVHGKNHHAAGSFGGYVTAFELLRSYGEKLRCTTQENENLFRATLGGMGLTGLILWAELRLKRIRGPFVDVERIPFGSLEEFFQMSEESDRNFEYTVSWIDSLAGRKIGRGILLRGNHSQACGDAVEFGRGRTITVPFDVPGGLLNSSTLRVFNALYFQAEKRKRGVRTVHYDSFFYPLDAIRGWNRLYGRRGLLQYQCVVGSGNRQAIEEMLAVIAKSGAGSFLAILKRFGDTRSGGIMSFPRPGVTLALDFAYCGAKTLEMLERLDEIVRDAGGAVYPAKDARMSPESFDCFFPEWRCFAEFLDPKFSSSFWRRVAKN